MVETTLIRAYATTTTIHWQANLTKSTLFFAN